MKPLGRYPVRYPNKIDSHIRGCLNWWEVITFPNKTKDKREAQKEIKFELEEKD